MRCLPLPSRRAVAGARPGRAGFTMVEIALSLAVVAFAMVAILGVLPTGLRVQKDNREETLVNADGAYLLEAIRTGKDGVGLLSNSVYLVSINFYDGTREVIANDPPAISSQRLLGLLTTPASTNGVGVSNVVAWVRALNTSAIGLDPEAREVAFRYQLVSEIRPVLAFPPDLAGTLSTNELSRVGRLREGLHEIRLSLRWPLYQDNVKTPQNARVGSRRRTFRASVGGTLVQTNPPGFSLPVFYFRPSVY